MGTRAHLLIEGAAELLPLACNRIERLERLWSRFIAESDVSRMNRAGGEPVVVAAETIELLARSAEGWRLGEGLFDPTLLNELVAAGYDRDFDEIQAEGAGPTASVPSRDRTGLGLDVDEATSTASVAAEVGFDSGGIGKGLAADMVSEELTEQGASAVMVNLGGDLQAVGAPSNGSWIVGIDNPFDRAGPDALDLVLRDRALATSTSLVRRWRQGGESRHHLIDPRTGRPSESDVASVTVVAERGWRAEALTKVALLAGVDRAPALLTAAGATGLIIGWDGRIRLVAGIEEHLTAPREQVERIALKDRALHGRVRLPG